MSESAASTARQDAFPLIRHFSRPVSRLLIALPVTPNQITSASLVSALAGAWCFAHPGDDWAALGALLFFVFYVLDNCDGEVARAKNLSSRFGRYYDTFVDWLGHSILFLGLGAGIAAERHAEWWLWCGIAAAVGSTINYAIGLADDLRKDAEGRPQDTAAAPPPRPSMDEPLQALGFFLRELSRADFCFILMVVVLVDQVHLLLPASAIGAQVYWMASFLEGMRSHHV